MKAYTTTVPITAEPMTWGDFCHAQSLSPYGRSRSEAEGYVLCLATGTFTWMCKRDFEKLYKEMEE